MGISIIFETHSISEDNELGIATGWNPGRLSEDGRRIALELGNRRRNDGIQAAFSSDLRRAVETVEIGLGDTTIPILHDWRLRECDYGDWNGMPRGEVLGNKKQFLDEPYPHGESWRQAVHRVSRFLDDLPLRWEGKRVLVVGHVATRLALDHALNHITLEELLETDFHWQPGWEYFLP